MKYFLNFKFEHLCKLFKVADMCCNKNGWGVFAKIVMILNDDNTVWCNYDDYDNWQRWSWRLH